MPDTTLDLSLTALVAFVLTLVAAYAGSMLAMRSQTLLDSPNERSSHNLAVSRAGGVAMLVATVAGLFVIAAFSSDNETRHAAVQFLVLAVFAGGVGLADDRANLSAPVKFGGQVLVAAAFVWWVGPLAQASIPYFGMVELGSAGVLVTVFWIVAFLNVFNFMDGVNGIAGGAAAIGLMFFAIVAGQAGLGAGAVIALLALAATLGFLPANVVRGQLFMGDCGSHFLAFIIAGLAVYAANASDGRVNPLLMPTIFLPFIIDVAFTLTHRIMRKRNILVAHREHIYQLILQCGATHATVAAFYAGAVAFCAAGAIAMLALPPAWMWAAPAIISILLLIVAMRIYAGAKANGMIDEPAG